MQLQRLRIAIGRTQDGQYKPGSMNMQRVVRFQPHCENCFRTPFDIDEQESKKLMKCEHCNLAFFCSEDCRSASLPEHRQKKCSALQQYAACEVEKNLFMKETGKRIVQMLTKLPRTSYQPLTSLRSWKDYFEFSYNPLVESIDEAFRPIADVPNSSRASRLLTLATNPSSFVLTILAGLE